MTALAASMDNYHANNHVRLGQYLINRKEIPDKLNKKLGSLQRYFFGGGSPTLAFLAANAVNHSNDLVKKLRDHAKKVKREDLIEVLKPIDDKIFMKDLTAAMNAEIADLLDKKIPGVSNWESFASHFKHNYEQRQAFENQQTVPGSFSPTKALIQILHGENPKLPVSCIINWAKNDGRNDIAILLKEFIKNKKEEWQREHNQNGFNVPSNQIITNDLDSSRAAFALTPDNRELNQPSGPTESDDTSETTPTSTDVPDSRPSANSSQRLSLSDDRNSRNNTFVPPVNDNGEPDLG